MVFTCIWKLLHRVLTGVPGSRSPCFEFLSTDCFTAVMRKILIVPVLLRNWKFTLVDNTGPTVTKAAVISLSLTNLQITKEHNFLNIRTQLLSNTLMSNSSPSWLVSAQCLKFHRKYHATKACSIPFSREENHPSLQVCLHRYSP